MLARSGFFQKCSKRWLFPSMQDAVEHAKHGLPLVSNLSKVDHGQVLSLDMQCHSILLKVLAEV